MKTIKIITIVLLAAFSVFAQESTQTFLSLEGTGVEEFHKTYPEYDGRETIIIILDTGVDIGVDGLTKTSTGEVKFIDVQDFTHQGDVQLFEADVDKEENKTIFKDEDEKYSVIASSPLQNYQKIINITLAVLMKQD
jgi:DNA integrity scanning protein DisA with diadenylate cyclase activity